MDLKSMTGLSAGAISSELPAEIVGSRVLFYPRLASTMDVARREALEGTSEGTAIIADVQTAGRGRLKRSWLAPSGNVALSVVLYPRASELPFLVMLASLSVIHSIEAIAGIRAQIKWPNDVLIKGRKVSGILIETNVHKERVTYAIVGVGINVDLSPSDFPEIRTTATSLSAETGRGISRLALVRELLTEMDGLYRKLRQGVSLYEEWRDNLVTLGQSVKLTSSEGVDEGIAETVERDGTLLLRRADGSLSRVVAGDVTLRA